MAATAAQRAQLRRMVNEPTTTTYSDATLATYIESHPVVDARGESPFMQPFGAYDTVIPGALAANDDWTPTYDLNAAAADIWAEKAASATVNFDFTTDGQSFSRNQVYLACMRQSNYYRSRRAVKTITLRPEPRPDADDMAADEAE